MASRLEWLEVIIIRRHWLICREKGAQCFFISVRINKKVFFSLNCFLLFCFFLEIVKKIKGNLEILLGKNRKISKIFFFLFFKI